MEPVKAYHWITSYLEDNSPLICDWKCTICREIVLCNSISDYWKIEEHRKRCLDKPMTDSKARSILERKCAALNCWHRTLRGYIYCSHCLYRGCSTIKEEDRPQIIEAMKILNV